MAYLFLLLLLQQHLVVLLQNPRRVIIEINLEGLLSGNELIPTTGVPQLLDDRMVLLYDKIIEFLGEIFPASIIRSTVDGQGRLELDGICVIDH